MSREDGMEELKKDILGCYKNPKVRLTVKPVVKFEGGRRFREWSSTGISPLCH